MLSFVLLLAGDITMSQPLTQEELLRALRVGAKADQGQFAILLTCIVAIVILGIALLIYRWFRGPDGDRLRRVDYVALVGGEIGLSLEEQALTKLLAQKAGIREPLSILLSPANLAHAADCASGVDHVRLRPRIEALSERLFGQPLPF